MVLFMKNIGLNYRGEVHFYRLEVLKIECESNFEFLSLKIESIVGYCLQGYFIL